MMLRLDWTSYDAAAFACRHWHYSRSVPASRLMVVGVWEDGDFKGVVTFSRGATPRIGTPYGLGPTTICELTRVALRDHATPVSRIVAIGLRLLRKRCPGLRLVISYAASERGHHGGIYQAGGWVYVGTIASHGFILKGDFVHARSVGSKYGTGAARLEWLRANVDPEAEKVTGLVRHKYLMPLDDEMREQIGPQALPYPKRVKQAMAGHPPAQRRGSSDPRAPVSDKTYARAKAEAHPPQAGHRKPRTPTDQRSRARARSNPS